LPTYLDSILQHHRNRAALDTRPLDVLVAQASAMEPVRGFAERIRHESLDRLAVIAEIKRRSPSKGDLNAQLDPGVMARTYESAGATCMSVLTDEPHFGGSAADLRAARSAVNLPVIRKDFTVSERDVCDARLMGADAVLLIAAALSVEELNRFHELAVRIGIDALVEIHDERELEHALEAACWWARHW